MTTPSMASSDRDMGEGLGASALPTGPLAEGGATSSTASPAKPSVPSASKCGCCGLPIHPSEIGVRHFGFYVAHSEHRCLNLLRYRIRDLELALDFALDVLIESEPPDSRAVSDEFVAAAAIRTGCGRLDECRTILASATEARGQQ